MQIYNMIIMTYIFSGLTACQCGRSCRQHYICHTMIRKRTKKSRATSQILDSDLGNLSLHLTLCKFLDFIDKKFQRIFFSRLCSKQSLGCRQGNCQCYYKQCMCTTAKVNKNPKQHLWYKLPLYQIVTQRAFLCHIYQRRIF